MHAFARHTAREGKTVDEIARQQRKKAWKEEQTEQAKVGVRTSYTEKARVRRYKESLKQTNLLMRVGGIRAGRLSTRRAALAARQTSVSLK